jgi:tetratricopeptide (TPR) repeat protein
MRMAFALAAFCGMLLLSRPAIARTADQQWTYCSNQRGQFPEDAVIAGCTAIIQSGHADTRDLVISYTRRGNAYLRTGATERAITDYQRAIQLKPQAALSNGERRSSAAERMDIAASTDFENPIQLKRDQLASYYYNRGKKLGPTKEGQDDIATAIEISPRIADDPPVR